MRLICPAGHILNRGLDARDIYHDARCGRCRHNMRVNPTDECGRIWVPREGKNIKRVSGASIEFRDALVPFCARYEPVRSRLVWIKGDQLERPRRVSGGPCGSVRAIRAIQAISARRARRALRPERDWNLAAWAVDGSAP